MNIYKGKSYACNCALFLPSRHDWELSFKVFLRSPWLRVVHSVSRGFRILFLVHKWILNMSWLFLLFTKDYSGCSYNVEKLFGAGKHDSGKTG